MLIKKKINLLAPRLCKCGCGQEVKPGNRYICGHARVGKSASQATKRKISMALKGKPNGRLGKRHTIESKRKISMALKGRPTWNKGKHFTKETRRKMSLAGKGRHHTEEAKRKISLAIVKKWEDPNYSKKVLEAIFATTENRPTKPEKRLRSLLSKLFPGEYQYIGDGKVWINGKNPDFINVNGQKKIVELFGDYWHSRSVTGQSKKDHRKQRQSVFAQWGYQTLVVWEHELQYKQGLKAKLIAFHTHL